MPHPRLRGHGIASAHAGLVLLLLHVLLIRHMLMFCGGHAVATHGCDGLRVCGAAHGGCLLRGRLRGDLLLRLLLRLLLLRGLRGRIVALGGIGIAIDPVGGVRGGFGCIETGLEHV